MNHEGMWAGREVVGETIFCNFLFLMFIPTCKSWVFFPALGVQLFELNFPLRRLCHHSNTLSYQGIYCPSANCNFHEHIDFKSCVNVFTRGTRSVKHYLQLLLCETVYGFAPLVLWKCPPQLQDKHQDMKIFIMRSKPNNSYYNSKVKSV